MEYRELAVPETVWFGGGALVQSVGIGTLQITRSDGTPLNLTNTLYVPTLVANPISVS